MNVGEKIKLERKKKNLSQKDLGKLIGVSGSMIGQYESGLRNPKFGTIKRIAEKLEIPAESLLDDDELKQLKNAVQNISENIKELYHGFYTAAMPMKEFFTPENVRNKYIEMITDIINTPPHGINLNQMCDLGDIFQYLFLMNEAGYSALSQYAEYIASKPEYCRHSEKGDVLNGDDKKAR